MTRIGVISDTHSYIDEKYQKYFSSCDMIIHAGDIGSLEVSDYLQSIAPLKAVYGNIDNHLIRQEFPLVNRFLIEEVDILITHIAGKIGQYNPWLTQQFKPKSPKILVCGHSHICKVQMDNRFNMLYINPGAAGVHGFHKVRTLLRFSIENERIFDMEVIELGTR